MSKLQKFLAQTVQVTYDGRNYKGDVMQWKDEFWLIDSEGMMTKFLDETILEVSTAIDPLALTVGGVSK